MPFTMSSGQGEYMLHLLMTSVHTCTYMYVYVHVHVCMCVFIVHIPFVPTG